MRQILLLIVLFSSLLLIEAGGPPNYPWERWTDGDFVDILSTTWLFDLEGEFFFTNESENGLWARLEALTPIPTDAVILGIEIQIEHAGFHPGHVPILPKKPKRLIPIGEPTPVMTDYISLAFYDEGNDYMGLVGENRATGENWTTTGNTGQYGGVGDMWGLDYITAEMFSDPRFGIYFNASGIGDGWEGLVVYAEMSVRWRPPEDECKAGNGTLTQGWITRSYGYTQESSNSSIAFYGFEFDPSVSTIDRLEWWIEIEMDYKKRGMSSFNLTALYGLGLLNEEQTNVTIYDDPNQVDLNVRNYGEHFVLDLTTTSLILEQILSPHLVTYFGVLKHDYLLIPREPYFCLFDQGPGYRYLTNKTLTDTPAGYAYVEILTVGCVDVDSLIHNLAVEISVDVEDIMVESYHGCWEMGNTEREKMLKLWVDSTSDSGGANSVVAIEETVNAGEHVVNFAFSSSSMIPPPTEAPTGVPPTDAGSPTAIPTMGTPTNPTNPPQTTPTNAPSPSAPSAPISKASKNNGITWMALLLLISLLTFV